MSKSKAAIDQYQQLTSKLLEKSEIFRLSEIPHKRSYNMRHLTNVYIQ